jgi:ribosomal protein S18 acetylase RimI-like enzyme
MQRWRVLDDGPGRRHHLATRGPARCDIAPSWRSRAGEREIILVLILPFEDAGVRYAVCEPADVPELIQLLALTFTESDPPAIALGITPAEFEAFVTLVIAPQSTQELTIVARDLASGVLAGAQLNEDATTPPPDGITGLSEKFDPIFDLFGQLDDQLGESPVTEPGTVLHLFLIGVDNRFRGRGIARRLVQAALAHGSAMGYATAITEATNRTSQHICGKAGFTTRAQTSYADYRRDGVAVFASISEHGGPMAMVQALEPPRR